MSFKIGRNISLRMRTKCITTATPDSMDCYLLWHITRNERYNWCGFSEGSVLWTLERWIPHVSVGDTPRARFIPICLTLFAILSGRVFPFRHGRWAGREYPKALCLSRGSD